jgi:acetyltransferase
MRDGTAVVFRPIRPEDEPLVVRFHEGLSEGSVYLRYFHALKLSQRISHERLTRICFIDYDREMALVAEGRDPESGERAILGIGRLSRRRWVNEAEFALLIADKYQRHGLGTELLARLVRVGRDERLERITAEILPQNLAMQRLCERLGFTLTPLGEEGIVRAELRLD